MQSQNVRTGGIYIEHYYSRSRQSQYDQNESGNRSQQANSPTREQKKDYFPRKYKIKSCTQGSHGKLVWNVQS